MSGPAPCCTHAPSTPCDCACHDHEPCRERIAELELDLEIAETALRIYADFDGATAQHYFCKKEKD